MRDVDGPYLPLQDKSAYFILSPYYGRNQLIPLARNQDPFFLQKSKQYAPEFLALCQRSVWNSRNSTSIS